MHAGSCLSPGPHVFLEGPRQPPVQLLRRWRPSPQSVRQKLTLTRSRRDACVSVPGPGVDTMLQSLVLLFWSRGHPLWSPCSLRSFLLERLRHPSCSLWLKLGGPELPAAGTCVVRGASPPAAAPDTCTVLSVPCVIGSPSAVTPALAQSRLSPEAASDEWTWEETINYPTTQSLWQHPEVLSVQEYLPHRNGPRLRINTAPALRTCTSRHEVCCGAQATAPAPDACSARGVTSRGRDSVCAASLCKPVV